MPWVLIARRGNDQHATLFAQRNEIETVGASDARHADGDVGKTLRDRAADVELAGETTRVAVDARDVDAGAAQAFVE